MKLAALLGNDTLKQRLSALQAKGKLTHSFLLTGPEGSGRHTLARILCAAMQCTAPGERPCGVCPQCRKVLDGAHPDICIVDDPEKKTIPVKLVRDACTDLYIRPNEGQRKIYLFPRAQDLNQQGQNVLLKSIEEPPPYGTFLLLAEHAEQLLPTIRSRCAELQLGPVDEQTALPFLRQQAPDKPEQLLRAAYLRAGGFLGQALALLQGEDEFPAVQQLAAAYAARDRMDMLRVLLPMEKYKREQLLPLLQQLRACFCSALAQRGGFDAADQSAAQLVASRSGTELVQAADSLQTAIDDLAANASAGAVIGYLAMKLR